MYTFPDLTRLAVTQNDTPNPDNVIALGTVENVLARQASGGEE
jgi:hypothetical protein